MKLVFLIVTRAVSLLVGLEIHDRGGDLLLLVAGGLSRGDLVLVCESAEELFPADPVLGEVDLQGRV